MPVKLNILAFLAWPAILLLAALGKLDWWVVLALALVTVKVECTFRRKA